MNSTDFATSQMQVIVANNVSLAISKGTTFTVVTNVGSPVSDLRSDHSYQRLLIHIQPVNASIPVYTNLPASTILIEYVLSSVCNRIAMLTYFKGPKLQSVYGRKWRCALGGLQQGWACIYLHEIRGFVWVWLMRLCGRYPESRRQSRFESGDCAPAKFFLQCFFLFDTAGFSSVFPLRLLSFSWN